MERLKEFLETRVVNDTTIKYTEKSIQQTDRNKLVNDLGFALTDTLTALISDTIQVVPLKNGVGIVCDNEKVGMIPITINIKIPNFDSADSDLVETSELYLATLENKQVEKEKKELAKAEKIKQQKIEREQKAKAKADKLKKLKSE